MVKSFAYAILFLNLPVCTWVGIINAAFIFAAIIALILNKKGVKISILWHKIFGGTAAVLSLFHVLFAVAGYWDF